MRMRIAVALVALATLVACGRAGEQKQAPPAPAPPPAEAACNSVAINPAVKAMVKAPTAAAAQSLLGGPITPGVYDLVSMEAMGGAPAPIGDLWESVAARDTADGIVLDFAIVRGAAGNAPQRVSAR